MPIFSVFGVSAETIRVPIVIITLFSIIILYILCTKALNKKIALIAVLFFALAPSVIEHVRYDVGPNALELFLKTIALLICILISKTKRLWYAVILCFVVFLGIFNKLNFIWFLNSLIAAFIISNITSLRNLKFIKEKKNLSLLMTLTLGFGLSYLYYFIIVTQYEPASDIGLFAVEKNFVAINNNLVGILSGQLFYNYLFGNINSVWVLFSVWITVSIILIGIILSLFNSELKNSYQTKFYYYVLLNLIFTIVQIYITIELQLPGT